MMEIKIPLPPDSHCLLKPNQLVNFKDQYVEVGRSQTKLINLHQQLQIEPTAIFNYLKKFVGDRIEHNEVLAVKKTFFGQKTFRSPVSGLITDINHQTGTVTIVIDDKQRRSLSAYFTGTVSEIDNQTVSIKVATGCEYALASATSNFGGETSYLVKNQSGTINASHTAGKVVVSAQPTPLIITKLEALGAVGLVTGDQLPSETAIAIAYLKNSGDIDKIFADQYPYCLVNYLSCKIYFYKN